MNDEWSRFSWKQAALRAFIGSIILSALLGILALLAGDFGDLEIKVLLSSLSISAASLSALGGAALLESRGERIPAVPAMVLSSGGLALLLTGIWLEVDAEAFWKTTVTIAAFAVACSHVSLLRLARLSDRHVWVRPTTTALVFLLTLYGTGMLWAEADGEGHFRAFGVLSILVTAATLATPVLHRLSREDLASMSTAESGGAVPMLCPGCATRFPSALGDVTCPRCSVRFRIELRA